MCLNPGLDRGLAFIYAQGGSLLTEDGTGVRDRHRGSTAAVQWYLDLFKNGLGMTAAELGAGWCGEALGKGRSPSPSRAAGSTGDDQDLPRHK